MRNLLKTIIAFATMATAPALGQNPAVAPWSDVTSEARNYKNFRSLQIDPALANPSARAQQVYSYERPQQQNPSIQPPVQQIQPYQPPLTQNEEPSSIEAMYASRIAQQLEQFGYDLFGVPSMETRQALETTSSAPSAAVQDSFIRGTNDELDIIFTGQRNDRGRYKINNNGLLIIPDLPPIPASGRTIGQVRLSIESAARNLYNTEAFVSLSSVRQTPPAHCLPSSGSEATKLPSN